MKSNGEGPDPNGFVPAHERGHDQGRDQDHGQGQGHDNAAIVM
jgi:hypothetical protein